MPRIIFALLLFVSASLVSATSAHADKAMEQKTIRDYLMKNPDVVIKILNNAVAHERKKRETDSQTTLENARAELTQSDLGTIKQGSGDITLVEFFDYQCGYCKKAHPQVIAALKKDKNVKFILKEFPILGKTSTLAAVAAIASRKQGKYKKFHNAMLSTPGRLTQDKIFSIAKAIGIDRAKLKRDMKNSAIEEALQKNIGLGKKLGINGTPSFVVFNDNHIEAVSGVRSERELLALFNEVRAK